MRIYVGNLPFSFTEQELRDLFMECECHSLSSVKLIMDHATNRFKGFAFVDVDSNEEAERAIKELDKKMVNGKPLTVNEARPQVKRESRGGGGGAPFNQSGRRRFPQRS